MADYLNAPPSEPGQQGGSEQAPSTQTPPASSDTPAGTAAGQAWHPPAHGTGEPQGDPLGDYRQIFAEDPQLLPGLKSALQLEDHALGRLLDQAHTHHREHMTQAEQARLKEWGLGNDPVVLRYMAHQAEERTSMERTINDLQRELQRLQGTPGVSPVPAPAGQPRPGRTAAPPEAAQRGAESAVCAVACGGRLRRPRRRRH